MEGFVYEKVYNNPKLTCIISAIKGNNAITVYNTVFAPAVPVLRGGKLHRLV